MLAIGRAIGLGLVVAGLAGPVAAHPHVFIDTSVEVILNDQDRVVAVRIGWVYDELFSLMVVADHELDADADGVLTADEQARLLGFDMQWIEGYAGDSFALIGDRDLVLGPPEEPTASWDGKQVRTTHLRRLAEPVAIGAGPFVVQVYDPGYYTAYFIPFDPVLTGGTGRCSAEVWAPDPDAADQILKDALQEYTPDQDLEAEFPAVGKNFAEEVRGDMRRALIFLGLPLAVVLGLLWLTGGFDGLLRWVLAAQRQTQDALAGAVRAIRSGQPGAMLGLLTVCFTYGVLHAVGPGHGKALIGAYGLARRVPVLRLSGLALVASLTQAAVAVALVYGAVAVLGLSRDAAKGLAEGAVPALGNLLIAGLGLWLLWRGIAGLRRRAAVADDHHHDHAHRHDHAEDCGCGHAHGPTVAQVQALTGWRDTALLVAGIAMRPCSGALFLLILTWQLGIGGAGVAGAFAMGAGVALVTMAAAALAAWAREGAFAGLSGGALARAMPLVEVVFGAVILAAGLVLFWRGI